MSPRLIALVCVGFLAVPPVATAQRLSEGAAQERCGQRTLSFANSPRGMHADLPDRWDIRAYYRQCYHAYTGRYPAHVPAIRAEGFFSINGLLGLRGQS